MWFIDTKDRTTLPSLHGPSLLYDMFIYPSFGSLCIILSAFSAFLIPVYSPPILRSGPLCRSKVHPHFLCDEPEQNSDPLAPLLSRTSHFHHPILLSINTVVSWEEAVWWLQPFSHHTDVTFRIYYSPFSGLRFKCCIWLTDEKHNGHYSETNVYPKKLPQNGTQIGSGSQGVSSSWFSSEVDA